VQAVRILDGVEGIRIVKLTHKDVVRHELVQRIICAYERYEKPKRAQQGTTERKKS
jgi:phosphate starvation-inducible PhoH-like protein